MRRHDHDAFVALIEKQRELHRQLEIVAQDLLTHAGKVHDHAAGFRHVSNSCPTCAQEGEGDVVTAQKELTMLEQLRHVCSVALGDLLALGMPTGASTGKLLQEAISIAEKQLSQTKVGH